MASKRRHYARPAVPVQAAVNIQPAQGQRQPDSSKQLHAKQHSGSNAYDDKQSAKCTAAARPGQKRAGGRDLNIQPPYKKLKGGQSQLRKGDTNHTPAQQLHDNTAQQQQQLAQQTKHHQRQQGKQQQQGSQLQVEQQQLHGQQATGRQKQQQQQQQQQAQQPQDKLQQNGVPEATPGTSQQQPPNIQHKKQKKRCMTASTVDNHMPCAAGTEGNAIAAKKAATAAAAAATTAAAQPSVTAIATVVKPWQPKQAALVSSNWEALRQQLAHQQATTRPGRRGKGANGAAAAGAKKQIGNIGHVKGLTPILAMDCEMVGVGPGGERDSLARVSIVNASGNMVYDSFVAQKEPVTDYRTWVSGVTPQHLLGAPQLSEAQAAVSKLLEGRTLVGHGLRKDLAVLMLSHPRKNVRDTAKYPPFMFSKGGKRRPRALKHLALQELGVNIQEGQHSSVDDARAALYLYQKHAATWEKALKTPQGLQQLPTANRAAVTKRKRVESYASRDVKDDPMADL